MKSSQKSMVDDSKTTEPTLPVLLDELDKTKEEVMNTYSNGLVKSIFEIGRLLADAKARKNDLTDVLGQADYEDKYNEMVENLPFGKKVADKFIRIYLTPYLRKIGTNPKLSRNLPDGYNNLYALTHKDIVKDPKVVMSLSEGFEKGNFISTKGVKVPSTKMTAVNAEITRLTNPSNDESKSGLDQDDRSEPVLNTVFATIKVSDEVFGKDQEMVWKLKRFLKSLKYPSASTSLFIEEKNVEKLEKVSLEKKQKADRERWEKENPTETFLPDDETSSQMEDVA